MSVCLIVLLLLVSLRDMASRGIVSIFDYNHFKVNYLVASYFVAGVIYYIYVYPHI